MKSANIFRLIIPLLLLFLMHCAELGQLARIQQPGLDVAGMRITALSLDKIDLAFDLQMNNPNPLSVTLAGFDYDLFLNGHSFVKGRQDDQLQIQANGASMLEIPVSLSFREIYETYQSMKNRDSTDYQLNCGLSFDLPILGPTRIPATKSGHLPLIKIPKISVSALKVEKLNFTGADLTLELSVENPNTFEVLMNRLNYVLKINGSEWASGNTQQVGNVNAKKHGILRLPVSLNFLEMGRTAYQIVSGKEKVQYELGGTLMVDTSNPLLRNVSLPLDAAGAMNISLIQ